MGKKTISVFSKNDTINVKAIAILLMVYYHSVALAGVSYIELIGKVVYKTGNICVTLFAFISAYGITKKINSCKDDALLENIVNRVKKIYYSYLPAVILAMLITVLMDRVNALLGNGDINTFSQVYGRGIKGIFHVFINMLGLTHIVYGNNVYTLNQTWWYMSLALIIAIATPIFVRLFRNKLFKYIAYMVTIVLMIVFKSEYFQYLTVIYIGIEVAQRKEFANIESKTIVGGGVIILFWLLYRGIVGGKWNALVNCLVAYPIIILIVVVIGNRKIRLLQLLGRHSANIFYLHSFVYLYWSPVAQVINKLRLGVAIWIATLVISIVLSVFLEKIKQGIHFLILQIFNERISCKILN